MFHHFLFALKIFWVSVGFLFSVMTVCYEPKTSCCASAHCVYVSVIYRLLWLWQHHLLKWKIISLKSSEVTCPWSDDSLLDDSSCYWSAQGIHASFTVCSTFNHVSFFEQDDLFECFRLVDPSPSDWNSVFLEFRSMSPGQLVWRSTTLVHTEMF